MIHTFVHRYSGITELQKDKHVKGSIICIGKRLFIPQSDCITHLIITFVIIVPLTWSY